MPMHVVPYVVGAFMATPFFVWAALSAVISPGSGNGSDGAAGLGLVAASLPLAAWFFVRGVATVANSMAGRHADAPVAHPVPAAFVRWLPTAAQAFGLLGGVHAITSGAPLWAGLLVAAVGLFVAVVIRAGERASAREHGDFVASFRASDDCGEERRDGDQRHV